MTNSIANLTKKILWEGSLWSGSISLNETIANYKYLELFFTTDDLTFISCKAYVGANSTSAKLSPLMYLREANGSEVTKTCNVAITGGTNLTSSENRLLMWYPVGTLSYNATGSYVCLKQVVGYK